jgi:hypothetical protein
LLTKPSPLIAVSCHYQTLLPQWDIIQMIIPV